MLDATSRVAIASLLHDLGKLAERARIEAGINDIDGNKTTYCPKTPFDQGARHTHIHAAYTGLAWDELEKTGHFPDLRQHCEPFKEAQAGNFPDSAVNAASAHHRPETFLQWIIATADRVASGFERDEFDVKYNSSGERDNHYCARLLTLFEQIGKGEIEEGTLAWRYPLKPLSPQVIFPQQEVLQDNPVGANSFAQSEYLALWIALLAGLKLIPISHRHNLPLWLDHFDALYLTITHAIPAATAFGVKPEVSLYDHSKATAALAAALWRWHHEHRLETVSSLKNGWDGQKFLLVQGDFFGIQNFIFAEGGQTNKHAHKLLRGRSFQVALLAECAALRLLESLELPPTSQIINAAGKFLIVAPNTQGARHAIDGVRKEFNDWCLKHTYGEIGIGIATTSASCNDFSQKRFGELIDKLFKALDKAKHQRFDLCGETKPVFDRFLDEFDKSLEKPVCQINGRYPADPVASGRRPYSLCKLADDQIRIGEALTRKKRVLISKNVDSLPSLALDYFGWQIAFVPDDDISGKYGQLATERKLIRCWDFDLADEDGTVFRGYARRFVNSYVPRWNKDDRALKAQGKYDRLAEDEIGQFEGDEIKTLHVLAAEDGNNIDNPEKWRGEIALVTLKGDVDNLGALFQQGLEKPTFAKWASLSRQVNLFFALWLPWFCEYGTDAQGVSRYRNTYTVFAGGDDFFLIGPWQSTIQLAGEIRRHFKDYVVNEKITFSAGMVMTQPKVPARQLARSAEAALEKSKVYADQATPVGANSFAPTKPSLTKPDPAKNAATLWNQTVSWTDWQALMIERAEALNVLLKQADAHGAPLSSGMIYSLLQLADKCERDQPCNKKRKPEDSLWRSQLAYRTARLVKDRKLASDLNAEIAQALLEHRGGYRLPLSVLLYGRRE